MPHSSLQLSANADSCVCVCAEELPLLLPWSEGEEEEGEQVAYLALDCRDQQVVSEPYGVVLAQRLNDGWR